MYFASEDNGKEIRGNANSHYGASTGEARSAMTTEIRAKISEDINYQL